MSKKSAGFGWFVLIVIATYTANLAAILFDSQANVGGIASIQDVIDQGQTVCVPGPMASEFQARFPRVKTKVVSGTLAGVIKTNQKI